MWFIRKFVCPGCKSCHVGNTGFTLQETTKERAYVKGSKNGQSAIYEHLPLCTHYSHISDLFKIYTNRFKSNQFNASQIRDNTIILDMGNNCKVLLFKEALIIEKHRLTLNYGLMASKESELFWLHLKNFIRHIIYSFNIKLIIPFLTFQLS